MSTTLTTPVLLDGMREAMLAFVRYAERAGLPAPVPTCPEWTVRDLVAHQGMVHRWAAAVVRGEQTDKRGVGRIEEEGRRSPEPLEWLADGAIELAAAITRATDDVDAPVFLDDAPEPKRFWARRQAHETTMHAVDAMAASLGRPPHPEEVTWVRAELAADGIDELLGGFLTRPTARLRCDEPSLLVVDPTDVADRWEVRLGPDPAITTRRRGGTGPAEADWELTGTAVELHLRLWNRTSTPPTECWPERAAVRWT